MEITILPIKEDASLLESIRKLFIAYQTELNENLCFQSFDEELQNPLKKYGEPNGALIVAMHINEMIGCVALQPLPNNSCEMKRLYVVPTFRKNKVGELLVKQIIVEAKKRDYATMKLDTLTRLVPAIKLYEKYGFENVNAYYKNPLPNVVYMEKQLV